MNKIVRNTLIAAVVAGVGFALSACGSKSDTAAPAAESTTAAESIPAAAPLITGPVTGPEVTPGCTPLTPEAVDALLVDKYTPVGTWFALPDSNVGGFLIGGVATPDPSGKLEMTLMTVPTLDAAGLAGALNLNFSGDAASGAVAANNVQSRMAPLRTTGLTDAQLNGTMKPTFDALAKCRTAATATTPASTPAPAPAPTGPVTVSFTCYLTEGYETSSVADLHAVWAAPMARLCSPVITGSEYSDVQTQAVATAYGAGHDMKSLNTLYGLCAKTDVATLPLSKIAEYGANDSQINELVGMLVLCPDHPAAGQLQSRIDEARTLVGKKANGELAGEGKHLVGTDIQPGTWQSVGDKVEDCYWEISDAQGEIMDKNFISVAPQFTIEIPADAAGFTNNGCKFEKIG